MEAGVAGKEAAEARRVEAAQHRTFVEETTRAWALEKAALVKRFQELANQHKASTRTINSHNGGFLGSHCPCEGQILYIQMRYDLRTFFDHQCGCLLSISGVELLKHASVVKLRDEEAIFHPCIP